MSIRGFGKKILSAALCLCMVFALLPVTALADTGVAYLDDKGVEQTCTTYTTVTSTDMTWGAAGKTTWYVLSGNVTVSSRITVSGTVNLILKDGCTLTATSGGINVGSGQALTIYGQTAGTGAVVATGDSGCAGIGGGRWGDGGTITINGGTVNATGGFNGAGIGGGYGYGGAGGTVTISGGSIQASGNSGASAIGNGVDGGSDGTVTIAPADGSLLAVLTGDTSPYTCTSVAGSPFSSEYSYISTDQYARIAPVTATVTGVSVTPVTVTAIGGRTQQFSAMVQGESGVSQAVAWSVSGNSSKDTTISGEGLLTVGADETAALTVYVTSTADISKTGSAAVTVQYLLLAPMNTIVKPGGSLVFSATLVGLVDDVIWSVTGQNSTDTTISGTGVLTVAAGETAEKLTVTATAKSKDTIYQTAKITISSTPYTFNIGDGNITITSGTAVDTLKVNYGGADPQAYVDNIPLTQEITLTGTSNANMVTVNASNTATTPAKITISGLNIDVSAIEYSCAFSIASGSAVALTLDGTNTLKSGNECAGLRAALRAAVTIGGSGSLTATGGNHGAGIGAGRGISSGTITVNGGTVDATGGSNGGAGIGGGYYGSGGTITISGGSVTATGGNFGAGIGGGNNGSGGTITISGGTIDATGGGDMGGAGIGGGNNGSGGTITISGGTIDATGGSNGGAGIGGGRWGGSGTIIISPVSGTALAVLTGGTSLDTCASVAGSPFSTDYTYTSTDRFAKIVTVSKFIVLSPATATVIPGSSLTFSATLVGLTGNVIWSVSGNNSTSTTISSAGVLTVAAGETATTLTVKATAENDTDIFKTATVSISGEIILSPTTANMIPGSSRAFSATLVGLTGGVNWSVSGNNNTSTTISSAGVLTVAAGETATTLTVKATAENNSDIFKTATVTIQSKYITLSPATATVIPGSSRTFSATLVGFTDDVIWSVSGNNSTSTTISSAGVLTVATGETADTLTVKATAEKDPTLFKTATVTVPSEYITLSPATATVIPGSSFTFSAKLVGLTGDVIWSVSGNKNTSTTISDAGVLTVAADETADTLTVKATAENNSDIFNTAIVTIPSKYITLSPTTATVLPGSSLAFSATLVGLEGGVTWSVTGQDNTGTTISDEGVLTVATDETAEKLTVTATAKNEDTIYEMANVTVGTPNTFDIGWGSIIITNGTAANTLKVSYGGASPQAYMDNIPLTQEITLTGTSSANTVTVNASNAATATPAKVTVNSLSIDVSAAEQTCAFSIVSGSAVSLSLVGSNELKSGSLCAGLQVPSGAAVVVGGSGSLTAIAGTNGAGIGGGSSGSGGTITITGGTVTASGSNGAGIGGGFSGNGGTVTITGGTVSASATGFAAGIGGGHSSSDGTITITGGTVSATGGKNYQGTCPAIGAGYNGTGCTVTVVPAERNTITVKTSTLSVDAVAEVSGSPVINPATFHYSVAATASDRYAVLETTGKLATPTNLAWGSGTSAGVASWDAVTNVSNYELMLYKDGTRLNYLFPIITDTSHSFASYIESNGTGSYTFTVKAWGDGTVYKNSETATSAAYAYTAPATTVSTPTFSPAAGTYTSAQSVTLSCATEGATIRYTTDGSEPTESNGTVYTSAISISADTTIKAKAFKTGMTASATATAAYTISLTPTIAFTTRPAGSTSVTAGSITGSITAAATVTPSGTATLNWFACNSSGTISGSSLGTGGSFTIPTTLTAGTYYYLCQATYAGATTVNSNVATVTVSDAPAALGGEITLGTNSWKQFLNTITFGLFFKDTQTVTVAGSGGGGTYTISYFTSPDDLAEETVKAKAEGWQSYTAAFSITPDADVIVYARIADGTDTVYLRSDRITVDGTAPTFSLTNGTTYTTAQTLTVSDNYALKSVLLDGTEQLASDFNGKTKDVTLSANGTYTVKAIDRAGNEATISVTINIPAPPAAYDLVSITDPTAVTGVANGTALDSITLPSSVTIDSGTGGPTSAGVTWDRTASSITYDPTVETEQTFTIPGTVTLPDNVTNTSSVSLNVSVSVTVAAKEVITVTDITVKTSPIKTTYTEGDALDLDGLEVALTYSDTSTKDVALADFGANDITANPANGATLSTVGMINVVITAGNTTVNIPITVNAAPVTPTIAFTTQPASSTTVTAGNITGRLTAAASVTPSGEAELNWFACDSNGTISGSSLGTGGSFTIPTTLTAGTYYYLCQATCSGAATVNSNVATVTVSDAPATTYTISVSADPTAGGTATGGGTYNKNDSVTVAVTANSGYHFVKWTEGGTQVSTSASYTFSVTADRTLVAVFEADTPTPPTTYTVTVNGSHADTTGAGSYASGETVYIYAGTRNNYSFDGWTSNDIAVIGANSRNTSFTMPDKNVTVTANWSYNGGGGGITYTYYTITAAAGEGGSISPSGSVSVREGLDKAFTITPKDGYLISDVTVDGVSVKSQLVSYTYTFENVQKSHTIKATFIEESKVNPDTGVENPFTDVKDTDWFFKDVMFVYDRGLMIGTSDSTFSPYATTTRAMVATTIWRMEGKPTPSGSNPFADVESGKYYTDAVTWAKENSIVAGYSATSFGPNDPVTREQLAMFFYNYAKYKGYDTGITGSLDKFTDKGDVSDWAQDAMQWAVGYGLIQGKTDNTLDPKGNATRAEFAAMLHRFIEKNELVEGVTTTGLMGWIDPKRLGIPNTGDTASSAWPFVMFASLAACAVLILQNKRREDAQGGMAEA